jgi:adenylate cyclase class 2
METEIEAKWLSIQLDEFRALLKNTGAILIYPERLMTRKVFDYPDMRLDKIGGWVRVRNEGDKVTMSYKQLRDRTISGTREVIVIVDNFDSTCTFLESIGLVANSFQETKRESWKLDGVEIEIDTWPWIPSFVELEARTEESLENVAKKLQLDYKLALHGSVETAYQAVYDVSEADIDSWPEIKFSDVPEWLAKKAK